MNVREGSPAPDQARSHRPVCGLDWAAQPPGRAAAVLASTGDALRLVAFAIGLSDAGAAKYCRDTSFAAVGVDIPFGWPREFTRFIAEWRPGGGPIAAPESEAFRYRLTDRIVRDRLRKHPLSVSSDRISLAARSWVTLVHREGLGAQIDCGLSPAPGAAPPIIEVYPGAALSAICGARPAIRSDGYKKDPTVRQTLLASLVAEFNLDLNGKETAVIGAGARSDGFDALVAALVTAMYAGLVPGWTVYKPGPEIDPDLLRQEGWIFFPAPEAPATAGEPDFAGGTAAIQSSRKSLPQRAKGPPSTASRQSEASTPLPRPMSLTGASTAPPVASISSSGGRPAGTPMVAAVPASRQRPTPTAKRSSRPATAISSGNSRAGHTPTHD
jgi:hypothetical protein